MKRSCTIGTCFLLGLSLSLLELGKLAVADDALPDASVLAYRNSGRRPPQQPQAKVSEVTLNGKISSMQSNGLLVKVDKTNKSKDSAQWLVVAGTGTTVKIHATATLDYLRKGQIIEFSGEIVTEEKTADKPKSEKVADAVKEVTIVSRKHGSTTQSKSVAKDHAAEAGIGGGRIEAAKPAEGDTVLTEADDSKPAAGAAGTAPAKPKAAAVGAKTKTLGRVESIDGKSLSVSAGERTIHLDLADEPTIKVELTDPKIIPDKNNDIPKTKIEGSGPGGKLVSLTAADLVDAKIIVHGTGTETKTDKQCAAKSIDVTLATPLTGKTSASPAVKKALADK